MNQAKRIHETGQPIIACETYIVCGDKVLMQKRAEDKKRFPGFWIGPGGHVDDNEDVLTAAIREIKEETGIDIDSKNVKLKVLAFHHHTDRKEIWVEYLFRTSIPYETTIINNHEGTSEWVPIPDLLKMENVFPPSKHYFDHILNDKPGILYEASQWKDAQLIKVLSQRIGNI